MNLPEPEVCIYEEVSYTYPFLISHISPLDLWLNTVSQQPLVESRDLLQLIPP